MEFYDKEKKEILAVYENGNLEIIKTNEYFSGGESVKNKYVKPNHEKNIIQKIDNVSSIAFEFSEFANNKYFYVQTTYQFTSSDACATFAANRAMGVAS